MKWLSCSFKAQFIWNQRVLPVEAIIAKTSWSEGSSVAGSAFQMFCSSALTFVTRPTYSLSSCSWLEKQWKELMVLTSCWQNRIPDLSLGMHCTKSDSKVLRRAQKAGSGRSHTILKTSTWITLKISSTSGQLMSSRRQQWMYSTMAGSLRSSWP